MARAKREEQRVVRDQEAWELRLRGWGQQKIADHLGVSQALISMSLDRTEKRLAAEFAARAAEIKGRQTAQLELVYREALEQWRRSCEDAERHTTVSGRAKATNEGQIIYLPDQETRVVEGQSGNPALLAQAMAALAAIRAIWGLEAPRKQELTGANGGPIEIDSEGLRDDLQRRLAGLAAAAGAGGVPGEPDAP